MTKQVSYITCPVCKETAVPIEINMDELKGKGIQGILAMRKKVMTAKKNPVKAQFVEIKPCMECGAVPKEQEEKRKKDKKGDENGECETADK